MVTVNIHVAHKRTSHFAMLIDEQEKSTLNVSQQEVSRDAVGQPPSLLPAYSQAVGSSNYAAPPANQKSLFGHTTVTRNGDDEDFVTNAATSSTGIPAPVNFVHVFNRDGAIRGTWNIHPGLQIPALLRSHSPRADTNYAKSSLWKQDPEDKLPLDPQPNLLLHTRRGTMHADVWISDSAEQDTEEQKKQPTLLDLNTLDGKITLRVVGGSLSFRCLASLI